jgi:hypothetical protein
MKAREEKFDPIAKAKIISALQKQREKRKDLDKDIKLLEAKLASA